MQITRIHDRSTFRLLREPWNALEGDHPFRCWEWVDACWQHFVDAAPQDGKPIAGSDRSSDQPFRPSDDVQPALTADRASSGHASSTQLSTSGRAASTAGENGASVGTASSATPSYQLQPRREPFVLAVHDTAGQLIGAAPWFLEHRRAGHAVLRWFGSEESCADYLSLLARPGNAAAVAQTLAEWLTTEGAGFWDLLELTAVDAEDQMTRCFAEAMADREATVHERPGIRCWRVALPSTWDDYTARLSKSHRKQTRRAARNILDTGTATVHTVKTAEQLEQVFPSLVELHQRRRRSLGEPGLFATPAYTRFQQDVTARLLSRGMLKLHWLTIDDRIVAVQYDLAGRDTIYSYQSGLDPEAVEHSPGWLLQLALLREAVAHGYAYYDFLRGDEPYKAHWRAIPRPMIEVRIVPNRLLPRIRLGLWAGQQNVKRWIKAGLDKVPATASHS